MFFRPEDVALKELLARWSMAFSKVLMCHLREDGDVQKELQVRGCSPSSASGAVLSGAALDGCKAWGQAGKQGSLRVRIVASVLTAA